MSSETIEQLKDKKIHEVFSDLTVGQLAIVIADELKKVGFEINKLSPPPEYVKRQGAFKVLNVTSRSAMNTIIRWGSVIGGIQVRKQGGSSYNYSDLKAVSELYWSSHSTVKQAEIELKKYREELEQRAKSL